MTLNDIKINHDYLHSDCALARSCHFTVTKMLEQVLLFNFSAHIRSIFNVLIQMNVNNGYRSVNYIGRAQSARTQYGFRYALLVTKFSCSVHFDKPQKMQPIPQIRREPYISHIRNSVV